MGDDTTIRHARTHVFINPGKHQRYKRSDECFSSSTVVDHISLVTAAAGTTSSGDDHASEPSESHIQQHPPLAEHGPGSPTFDGPRVGADCGSPASGPKSLIRYKGLDLEVCNRCYQRRYRSKTIDNGRPPEQEVPSEDRTADNSFAPGTPSISLDSISSVAGLEAAKALASKANTGFAAPRLEIENALTSKVTAKASTSPLNSVAPPDIMALFSQPHPTLDRYRTDDVPRSSLGQNNDYTGPRLVLPKVLGEEEENAAVARLKAQGVEIISVCGSDLDSLLLLE